MSQLCIPEYHLDPGRECYVVKELRNHRNWLQDLAAILPALKSFTINAYLDVRSNCVECQRELLSRQTALSTLDDLTALRVYESDMNKDWIGGNEGVFNNAKTKLMEYNPNLDALVQVGDRKVSDECDLTTVPTR